MPITSNAPAGRPGVGRRFRGTRRLFAAWLMLASAAAPALDPDQAFHDYRFDRWTVDDGLPQLSVLSITQDRDGYLWVGTQNGLARFDGQRFTSYDRRTHGADTTLAETALAASDGLVWFGTPRGLLWTDGERVVEVTAEGGPTGFTALAESADGTLLAASERGLHAYRDGTLKPLPGHESPAFGLLRDADAVWIGGRGEVALMRAGDTRRYPLGSTHLQVRHLARIGTTLWLGTPRGLWHLDIGNGEFREESTLAGLAIESLRVDGDGTLWVGTLEHLHRRHPDGDWERIESDDFFLQPWIRAIFEDRAGDLWLGSHRESLIRLRDSAVSRIAQREGLSDPFVWSVLRDRDGDLLIGTSTDLMAMTPAGRVYVKIAAEELGAPWVYSLAQDPDGTLWLGTRDGLLRHRGGRTEALPALAPLRGLVVSSVQRIDENDYWIGTRGGLYRFRDGELTAIGPTGAVPAAQIRAVLPLAGGSALVGTEAGLYRVNDGRTEPLPGTGALSEAFISRLAWVQPGLLAIATMDHGLGLWRDGRLMLLGVDQGLPTPNGWTLDVVGAHLYVSSIQGVYRIALSELPDPAAPRPEHVRAQLVVAGAQRGPGGRRYGCCNGGGDARSLREDDRLWYASSAGALRLDTTRIPPPPPPPPARVEFARNAEQTFGPNRPPRLDGASRDLEIGYTGLSLANADQLEFRYRLDGYDEDWRSAGARRTAYYTHLPPGEYAFRVQARHAFGEWGPENDPLPVAVVPRWYERTDIRWGLAALVVLLAAGLIARRIDRLQTRSRVLEQAVAERTQALSAANQALDQLSRTDTLTGLANRRALEGRELRAGAVLLLDLDHFKQVNDIHGHSSGDQVLVDLAGILRDCTRDSDRCLRWGGEEFVIIGEGLALPIAVKLAERIRRRVAGHRFVLPDGTGLSLSCSIGVAAHPLPPPAPATLEATLALADLALYRAKAGGRDRVVAAQLAANADLPADEKTLSGALADLARQGRVHWQSPGKAGG